MSSRRRLPADGHVTLAFLGLRYPLRMLPILLFEVTWKVIWIAAVAVPHLVADDIDAVTRAVLFNCSLVVIMCMPHRPPRRPAAARRPSAT